MNTTRVSSSPSPMLQSLTGLPIAAGVFLGMGFAGFFDGIVIHQILQWHHMLTSIRPATSVAGLEANTFWDGVFHVGAYALTATGLVLLWRSSQRGEQVRTGAFVGSLLIGAGCFNLVEGLIDHHLLGIHHVKSGPNQLAWDVGFLSISAVLAIVGWLLLRSGREKTVKPE
jgi:uncharacterized membrane protein